MSARSLCPVATCIVLAFGAFACTADSPPAPSCTYSVTSNTQTFTAAGGQGAATIATGAACSWTVTADSPWVSVSGAASGSGPATLQFGIAANSASDARKATLTIAGQPLAISQDGRAPCDYVLTPSSLDVAAAGGPASVTVSTAAGCSWTVSANVPWVTVTAGGSGSGNGTVSIVVAANTGTDERTAALAVAGRSVSLRQAGAAPAPPPQPVTCEYTVSPVDIVEHWHITGFTLTISTSAGCSWTASPSDTWLSIDRTAGAGPASIAVSFSQFTEDATRTASVQLRWPAPTAGNHVLVTQEGCRYGFDTTTATFTASGGTRTVTVVTQPLSSSCMVGCPWTAVSNVPWIHVTSSMPRAGDDQFIYLVDANTGSARVGTITVADRTHTVSQGGI